MSDSPGPFVQSMSGTPDPVFPSSLPAGANGMMPEQAPLDSNLVTPPTQNWLDPSPLAQPPTIPFTPDSSSYNQSQQPFQLPAPKSQMPQAQKPLFSWTTSQSPAQSMTGTYRDYSQPTPSTASSWMYGQTPSTAESFIGAPALTPLSSVQPDLTYTGISPTMANLAHGGLHTASLDVPRRPGPIRHHSAHSVSGVPMAPAMDSTMGWSTTHPSQVPPPLGGTGFTLSQPPFAARRPNAMPVPIFPPDPMAGQRRLHPSPDLRGGHPFRGMHRPTASASFSHMKQGSLGQDLKPPRFKPTAEQKAILIESYENNPNPDAATREALARRLGPDVKVKTLQIWFQNRRSKSKTKEQAAMNPKPVVPRAAVHRRSASREIDMNALRLMTRCEDFNMLLLPISVFAFASWRRFTTPGSSMPDLGASLHLIPPAIPLTPEPFVPHLHVYSMRSGATFRLTIFFEPSSVEPGKVQITTNPKSDQETVAVRLQVGQGKTRFAMWAGHGWTEVLDFTDGNASAGGQVELTGKKEIMIPAFTSVSEILSPSAPQPMVEPITPFGSSWKFPTAPRPSEAEHDSSTGLGLSDIESSLALPGQQHRSLSDSAIPPLIGETHSHAHDPLAGLEHEFLLNPGGQVMDEPLDLSSWDLNFSSSFEANLPLPSTATQTPSAGHAQTSSISDSEQHSTDTGEGSVNTPMLEGLVLPELGHEQGEQGAAGGGGGESSAQSLDFKWW